MLRSCEITTPRQSPLHERSGCCGDWCWFAHIVVARVPSGGGVGGGAAPYFAGKSPYNGSAYASGTDTAEEACDPTTALSNDICSGSSYHGESWVLHREVYDAGVIDMGGCVWSDTGIYDNDRTFSWTGNALDGGLDTFTVVENASTVYSYELDEYGDESETGTIPGAWSWPTPVAELHDPCSFSAEFSPITGTDSSADADTVYAEWNQEGVIYDDCNAVNRTVGPVLQSAEISISGERTHASKVATSNALLNHVDLSDPGKVYHWVTAWVAGYEKLVVSTYVDRTLKEHLSTLANGYYYTRQINVLYARHETLGQTIFVYTTGVSNPLYLVTSLNSYFQAVGMAGRYGGEMVRAKGRVHVNRSYGSTKPVVCFAEEARYDATCDGDPPPSDAITYIPEPAIATNEVYDVDPPSFPDSTDYHMIYTSVNVQCTFPTQTGFPSPECDPTA